MKQDESCVVLCRQTYKAPHVRVFKRMIDQEYRVHWLLDNLPVAVRNEELGYVSRGYPIGFVATTPASKKPKHYLFNHVRIIVRYTEDENEYVGSRIVGFEVVPFSIKVSDFQTQSELPSTTTTTLSIQGAVFEWDFSRLLPLHTFVVVVIILPNCSLNLYSFPLPFHRSIRNTQRS